MGLHGDILNAIKDNKNHVVLRHLYSGVLPKVQRYVAKHQGSLEDANDAFQDAVISFFHAVKTNRFDESQEIDGYLFTIARNAWLNKIRRDKKVSHRDELPDVQQPGEQTQLDQLITTERQQHFEEALQALGDQCRQLMRLSIYENLPPRELVKQLDFSSVDVARTYLYRCRKKLTEIIKQRKGLFITADS